MPERIGTKLNKIVTKFSASMIISTMIEYSERKNKAFVPSEIKYIKIMV